MSTCVVSEPQSQSKQLHLRVSILMLTYNRPQLIGRAIQSVLRQDFGDWELIIVHDGPNQDIASAVERWQRADDRIRYFHRPRGGNIANATNYGLLQAQGDYVAILDDDDFWISPHKLSKQVRFLDEHLDYVACGGGMIVVDQTGREKLRCIKRQNDGDMKQWALLANPIVHSSAMFRRSVIEECGHYDESLSGFQDWDVFLKLGRRGKLYNFPEEFTSYTMWEGGGSFAQHKKNTRSALTIVKRHGRAYRKFLPALALAFLHHWYAHLPAPVRELTFSFLSRAKKALFSERRRVNKRSGEEILCEPTAN